MEEGIVSYINKPKQFPGQSLALEVPSANLASV